MKKHFLWAGTGIALTFSSGADSQEAFDVSLREVRDQYRLPAAGFVIVNSQGIIASGVSGERVRGAAEEVTLEDRWHIGSITKAMTATLAVKLSTAGLITLDATVGSVLGDKYPGMNDAYRDVTLSQLLSHRAGTLSNLLDLSVWSGLRNTAVDASTHRQTLVRAILRHPPEASPGSQYIYSNAGYVVAGAMLEAVAGNSWEGLIAHYVFRPLAMDQTGFGAPGSPGVMDNARGHALAGGSFRSVEVSVNADNPEATGPAGTLHATLADLAKFASAHLGGVPEYLSHDDLETLHVPKPGEDYALGWQTGPHPCAVDQQVLTHTGSNTMWFTVVWLDTSANIGVVVTTNVGDPPGRRALYDLGERLWNNLGDMC